MIPSRLRSLYRVHSTARSIAGCKVVHCVACRDSMMLLFSVCKDQCRTCTLFVKELKRLRWQRAPSPFKVDAIPADHRPATELEPEVVKP